MPDTTTCIIQLFLIVHPHEKFNVTEPGPVSVHAQHQEDGADTDHTMRCDPQKLGKTPKRSGSTVLRTDHTRLYQYVQTAHRWNARAESDEAEGNLDWAEQKVRQEVVIFVLGLTALLGNALLWGRKQLLLGCALLLGSSLFSELGHSVCKLSRIN